MHGQWCYRFKFLEEIRLYWLLHVGFREIFKVTWCNQFKFLVLGSINRVFSFVFIQANIFFLKFNRILTKIDISCVKLNTRVLDPPTHSHRLTQIVGRFDIDMWVTSKTNRPSFRLILKLSHALDCLFSVLSGLHASKYKYAFCWIKDHWTWLLSDIVAWDSFWHGTHYLFSDIDAVTATFHVLVNKYFLNIRVAPLIVLRALVRLICLLIFNNFSVFNFPFLNYEQ